MEEIDLTAILLFFGSVLAFCILIVSLLIKDSTKSQNVADHWREKFRNDEALLNRRSWDDKELLRASDLQESPQVLLRPVEGNADSVPQQLLRALVEENPTR